MAVIVSALAFANTANAASFCSERARVLSLWNHAADYSARLPGETPAMKVLEQKFSKLLESLTIADLVHLRDAGRQNFFGYFQLSSAPAYDPVAQELFALGMHIDGIRMTSPLGPHMPRIFDRIISEEIRELALSYKQAGVWPSNLVETGKLLEWLPPQMGGRVPHPKEIDEDFATRTRTLALGETAKIYVGANQIKYKSSEPNQGLVQRRTSRSAKNLVLKDLSVVDAADLSPSKELLVTAGLRHDGKGEINLIRVSDLSLMPKQTVVLEEEPQNIAFITNENIAAVFEHDITTYKISAWGPLPLKAIPFQKGAKATASAISADKLYIFIGFEDGSRAIFHTKSGALTFLSRDLERPSSQRHTGKITDVGVDADGVAHFLSNSDGVITQWRP